MGERAAFIYADGLTRHVLSETHPLKSVRLRYTYELLAAYGVFESPDAMLLEPRPATEEELLRFHTQPYMDCVRRISRGDYSGNPVPFGLGPGDNPIYEGMYEASLLSTGASMRAAEVLLEGEADRAFSISGGLHHAMPANASGFCVFNDPVVAIEELLLHGMKVAYVDIDCHHGDGVQHAYYDTDAVLTVSVHESGAFLFPGTGFTEETGSGKGRGYSVNLPLYPYTTDEVYLWAFREVVPPLLEAYAPDVVVTQLGIDSHFRDPITHMALTVQGFGEAVGELAGVAPKWLALGGGGYDLQAVARAWTTAYAIMLDRDLPDEIPEPYRQKHRVSTLSDHDAPPDAESFQQDARTFAEKSIQALHRDIFPTHRLRGA